jgi:molybdopterin molybdotransferase
MINVSEAKSAILHQIQLPIPVSVPLMEGLGHVLANDVYAKIDIPAFCQSSMDGYAIKFKDRELPLILNGEMAAGTRIDLTLKDGEASRIFTGAPLPHGADTVVMQEKVQVELGKVVVKDESLKYSLNTRAKGAEVKSGALAIEKGSYLTPAALGFLAGIGEHEVLVYPMPRVSIILTGKELQSPGESLASGQVYESNSYSLRGVLSQAGIKNISLYTADDDLLALKTILNDALSQSDIVLLTGGVSVGDYDFVAEAARLCGIQKVFHKVKQKPGKPLYFGVLGSKLIFGLPGNPSSVLNCYYQFVLPAVEAICGRKVVNRFIAAVLEKGYEKNAGLTHFVKAFVQDGRVVPLGAQESFRMSSFAAANCMIRLDEDRTTFAAGEIVNVFLLPDIL